MPGKRTGFGDSHRENTAESADHPPEKLSERRDHSQSRIGKVRIELCVHLVTSFNHRHLSGEHLLKEPIPRWLIPRFIEGTRSMTTDTDANGGYIFADAAN